MTKIKLIATDIDGTFLNQDRQYNHDRFAQQLRQLAAANIRFVVASGNHLGHIQSVFAPTPGVTTFIAENGAQVVDHDHTLFATPLPLPVVRDLVKQLTSDPELRPQDLRLSGAHGTYVDQHVPASNPDVERYFFNNLVRVPDLLAVEDTIYKVTGDWQQSVRETAAKLNARFPGQIYATASGFGSIDIMAPHINKAVGLIQLAQAWQIAPSEIAAFGDNDNDIDMLREVGLGVAMANGTDSAKQVANLITPADNNHEGVLAVIDAILADKV